MDIELCSGSTMLKISTNGGYVTGLSDEFGDILFPKQTLMTTDGAEKTRGGLHVCLPNFGPGGASGLGQHGYGRTNEWVIRNQSEASVEIVLAGVGKYMGMESCLTYKVLERGFAAQLRLKNGGDLPLKVAPAFHPYWCLDGKAPEVNGVYYDDLAKFSEAQFISGDTVRLKLASRDLVLKSDELNQWAQWTDQLGDYLCIEPSQSGFSFDEDISRADILGAGEELKYSFTVTW